MPVFRFSLILFLLFAIACGKDNTDPQIASDTGTDSDAGKTLSDMTDAKNSDTDNTVDFGYPEVAEIIFEQKGFSLTNSKSGLFDFDVPPNTKSVLIMMSGKDGEFYTLASWKNGDGTNLVPENWAQGSAGGPQLCLACDNRVTASESVGTAYAPNNQDVEIKPGTHTASVFAFQQNGQQTALIPSTEVDIVVYANRFAETPFAQLALNFHFTGANGLTAESAKTSPEFQAHVDTLKDVYSQAKIELDEINYIDIDSTFQIIENVIAPESDLQEMFKLGENSGQLGDGTIRGLNVFFVDELLLEGPGGGFGILLGISGGIPGPIVSGTSRSGVAIAMKEQGSPTTPGFVMAHEVGHHLGLFHTSEQNMGPFKIHDQIDDTAENDTSLLMYFSGQGRTLSPNQIKVMRINPWVRYQQ